MAGGKERVLRRRIRSIQSTKKITKAMELIAASQIVKAQNRIVASKPYQRGMARIVLETALGDPNFAGRLLGTPDKIEKVAILALVSDRGLCGAYNSSVLRATERMMSEGRTRGVEYRLFTVGKKAQAYFRFRHEPLERSFIGMSERPTFADARHVAASILPLFTYGEVDQVMVVSTRFLSAGTQRVETRQLLPLVDPRELADGNESPGPEGPLGYTEFEPDAAILLRTLGPRAAETEIFAALLEASASEVTARQRAMAAATDNAAELITKYSRIMNRARQDAITTEIMEIVGGAEALRAGQGEEEHGVVIMETKV